MCVSVEREKECVKGGRDRAKDKCIKNNEYGKAQFFKKQDMLTSLAFSLKIILLSFYDTCSIIY